MEPIPSNALFAKCVLWFKGHGTLLKSQKNKSRYFAPREKSMLHLEIFYSRHSLETSLKRYLKTKH